MHPSSPASLEPYTLLEFLNYPISSILYDLTPSLTQDPRRHDIQSIRRLVILHEPGTEHGWRSAAHGKIGMAIILNHSSSLVASRFE